MILVWHVFQGAMVIPICKIRSNHFYAYWREIPNKWVATDERAPTAEDADMYNCVIATDSNGAVRMTGWHQIHTPSDSAKWQTPPDPPPDYKERWRTTE